MPSPLASTSERLISNHVRQVGTARRTALKQAVSRSMTHKAVTLIFSCNLHGRSILPQLHPWRREGMPTKVPWPRYSQRMKVAESAPRKIRVDSKARRKAMRKATVAIAATSLLAFSIASSATASAQATRDITLPISNSSLLVRVQKFSPLINNNFSPLTNNSGRIANSSLSDVLLLFNNVNLIVPPEARPALERVRLILTRLPGLLSPN
jgi:hypothetical protein